MLAIWLQVAFQASQPLQGYEKTKKRKRKQGVPKKGSPKKRETGFPLAKLDIA